MAPLTKLHRNGLFRVLEQVRVPVKDFRLETALTRDILTHLPTNSHFVATLESGNRCRIGVTLGWGETDSQKQIRASVDLIGLRSFSTEPPLFSKPAIISRRPNIHRHSELISWEDVLQYAQDWARIVNDWAKTAEEYESAPDLWAELGQSKSLLTEAEDSNTPFTAPEQAEISGQIKQIKDYIKTTYELTGEQIAEVEERLDQAERASHHMGRKDWLTLFYGALFALVLPAILPPAAVEHILVMTLHGLGHLFGIGGGPPPHLGHG